MDMAPAAEPAPSTAAEVTQPPQALARSVPEAREMAANGPVESQLDGDEQDEDLLDDEDESEDEDAGGQRS